MNQSDINRIVVVLVSEVAQDIAEMIKHDFPEAEIFPFAKFDEKLYSSADALVFIGAMGICVRSIAPFIKNKHVDPAVICIDSNRHHVVSVMSGHIGGANRLTLELAHLLGADPVITTQSDNSGLWAIDTFARKYDWTMRSYDISRKAALTQCVATFVNRKPTALLLDIRDRGTEFMERTAPSHVTVFYKYSDIDFTKFDLLVTVGPFVYFAPISIISFYPKVLSLGFGCRKDMVGDAKDLAHAITECLRQHHISPHSLNKIATIDIKKDEKILKDLTSSVDVPATFRLPVECFTADELGSIDVPNPSERVREATQSPSVSEASAIKAAHGGNILLEKQKMSLGEGCEFTIAVAIDRDVIRKGHIEIVGAGPGDPELISVRGKNMLEKADLILYAGSLVPKELTFYAKDGATVRSSADMNLEDQFSLMKTFYDRGLFVVRLHTGDPCIYGAIQEQMAFFDKFDMDYHITPGISSFQAAAAALNSQFTIPEKTQTIILTRGEGRTPMPEKEQLHKLAASRSTMCIFLSAGIVEDVQQQLLEHYPEDTPVAACYKLTWKDQRIYRGELKDLARIVKDNNLTLTTMLVVGDAIDNRKGLSRLYADEFKHLFRK